MVAFTFGDFGGLSGATLKTNAVPYKAMAAALIMREEQATGASLGRDDLPRLLRRFGFIFPDSIANWTDLPQPRFSRPLGMEWGPITGPFGIRIEGANLGCASCHGGLLYDAEGRPSRVAWLGLPNTSLDLEAYTRAVYQATRDAMRDRKGFQKRIEALFPEMTRGERFALRRFVLPGAAKRLARLEATIGAPTPFSNGGAGRTNGVGSLKNMLGLLDRSRYHGAIGTVSTPILTSRTLRSSLLADGCYAVPGESRFVGLDEAQQADAHRDGLATIVAFFTVPIMGISPERAERSIPEARRVMRFLAHASAPAYPGPVDMALAQQGRGVYEARCAGCHGRFATDHRPYRLISFPNRLVRQSEMDTDSLRWQAIDAALLARLRKAAPYVATERTGGYVAPILSGLWTTAPYLHNGSVPTLWHLMHPDTRPERFETGGHRLDFVRMGIAGEPDSAGVYRHRVGEPPWSDPETYDTRAPGLSNRGHEREFQGMGEDEKRALLEFLKCL